MLTANDIKYVGVNDRKTDLFEGQYSIPNGMAYNSYVILDEKTAVMDSVDIRFADEWISNVKAALSGRSPDYLVIQHMEPDHSSSIMTFIGEFPNTKIVSSDKAFNMMKSFFGTDFSDSRIILTDGSRLDLGKHTLYFITAPMVHWPEVVLSYDSYSGSLFSADAFGKFGALDYNDNWIDEARRYYFGIVGKYGCQVQLLLNKFSGLDIKAILPLHGPIINKNIDYYLSKYDMWSSYRAEENGVCIAYTSIYGNTKEAAELTRKLLSKKGVKSSIYDLARCDIHEAVASAFKYNRLVLASPTYNCGIFPPMREFINCLTERNYQNRTLSFIENGSWSPMAIRMMKCMLCNSKNLKYTKSQATIISTLNDQSRAQIELLANELVDSE